MRRPADKPIPGVDAWVFLPPGHAKKLPFSMQEQQYMTDYRMLKQSGRHEGLNTTVRMLQHLAIVHS